LAANIAVIWLAAFDVDGDGRMDLVNTQGDELSFQRSRGDGTFEPKVGLGWASEDRVIDATATTLDGGPAVLLHLERADAADRDAGFALVAPDPRGVWTERARTPWIGNSWLEHVVPLPPVSEVAFVTDRLTDFSSDAFVYAPSGEFVQMPIDSFFPMPAELDGVEPPELIVPYETEMIVHTTVEQGWDTAIELDPVRHVHAAADFDGDGLEDLVVRRPGVVQIWHNEGCVGTR
jgi:hypothetical protein